MGTDMTGAPNRVKGGVVLRFRNPNPAEQMQLDADTQRREAEMLVTETMASAG